VGAFSVSFRCYFYKFNIGYVQRQSLRAPALGAQEALQPHLTAQGPSGDQPGLGFESDGADLGLHLALRPGFVLLGLVGQLELDCG
jgi:hypothetical protein